MRILTDAGSAYRQMVVEERMDLREGMTPQQIVQANRYQGKMEVAVEVVSQIRVLRGLEGASLTALNREECITCLESVLNRTGLREAAEVAYDELLSRQQVKFEAIEGSEDVGQPVHGLTQLHETMGPPGGVVIDGEGREIFTDDDDSPDDAAS